jgi:hypothetical protein
MNSVLRGRLGIESASERNQSPIGESFLPLFAGVQVVITLNKTVYPTDFSTAAELAFDTTQRLARDSQALLLIVHVVDPATMPTAGVAAIPGAMGGVA